MKPNPTLLLALGACSLVGFLAGRISSDAGPQANSSPESLQGGGPPLSPRVASRGEAPIGPRGQGQSSARDRSTAAGPAAEQNLTARMERIMAEPDPLERAESWLRFVKDLDRDEVAAVVADFRDKDLARGNLTEYAMLLGAWTRHDPYAALDYASENTGTPFARQTILTSWATRDPLAAMRWAEQNHEGEDANPWMVGVIRGIAAVDPAQANELLNAMPYSRERGQALSAVQDHYLKQGPDAARAWAMAIPDERLRAGAISRVAGELARSDPKGTADWLLANPGEAANRAMDTVMARMVENNPQEAMSYFEGIADEELRGSAFAGIADGLSSEDPQAAARFIDSNPALATDSVLERFVWRARDKEPALAAIAIGSIRNSEQQNRTYRRYLGRWLRSDFQAATEWMNNNPLPQGVSKAMSNAIQRMENGDR